MLLKSIKTEVVFTKKEINNEWNINFLLNSPLEFDILIPLSFHLVEAPLKFLL